MARTPCPPVGPTVPQPSTWAQRPPGLLTASALVWRSHSRCSEDGRRVPSPCLSASLGLDRAFRLWAEMVWACREGGGLRAQGLWAQQLGSHGEERGRRSPGPRHTSRWAGSVLPQGEGWGRKAAVWDAGVARAPGSRGEGLVSPPDGGQRERMGLLTGATRPVAAETAPPAPTGPASSVGSCCSQWVRRVRRLLTKEAGAGARGWGPQRASGREGPCVLGVS